VVKTPKTDFVKIIRTLARRQVDFIVVGGIAAVVQGAAMATFDLDLVHSREPANIERLLRALEDLEARYRAPGAEDRRPARSHLASEGHQLLTTRAGHLDLLGIIGSHRGYEELLPLSIEQEVAGVKVRVLSLAAVIQTKKETGRDKDRAMLPLLERTLEEKKRRDK
jgi:predicted nucleotidyltransferase